MLVNLKQIIGMAEAGGYCVPAFNVYNIETVMGVIKAAEEAKAVKETRTAELDAAFKALVEAEKTYQKIAKAYYKDYPMSKNEINKALDEIFKIFA